MASSGAARLAQQLVALKQLTPAASRLLLSYLIFGKPLAIAAASELHGTDAAAVHGTFLIARNGADLLQETNYRWSGFGFHRCFSRYVLPKLTHSYRWYSSLVNNILLSIVGVTTKWLRHAYEVSVCDLCDTLFTG
jgi:hypothetical protein